MYKRQVQDITPRVVDKYIQTLQKTPAVNTRTHHAKTDFVTNSTIEKIIKLLRCAFKQAVRWELISKNPFENVILPKTEYKKRDIWTADMIRTALDQCTDSKLYVAMNLSFACSLRMGEILGLTWNNVHILSLIHISYKEASTTRLRIAEHLRKLPMSFFNTKDLSDITTNMTVSYTHLCPCLGRGQ